MTAEQRAAYAKQLAALANPEAQANTQDPIKAAEFVAWMAKRYVER